MIVIAIAIAIAVAIAIVTVLFSFFFLFSFPCLCLLCDCWSRLSREQDKKKKGCTEREGTREGDTNNSGLQSDGLGVSGRRPGDSRRSPTWTRLQPNPPQGTTAVEAAQAAGRPPALTWRAPSPTTTTTCCRLPARTPPAPAAVPPRNPSPPAAPRGFAPPTRSAAPACSGRTKLAATPNLTSSRRRRRHRPRPRPPICLACWISAWAGR